MKTINITLSGSYAASAEGITHDTGKRYSDPVPGLCRKLLRAGHDPAAQGVVLRDGVMVFRRPRAIGWWAKWLISDRASGGFRREPYTDPATRFPPPVCTPVSGSGDVAGTVTPSEAMAAA